MSGGATVTEADVLALAAKAYAPARQGLAAAQDVVAGCDDPDEAWERLALAGVIPESWVDDPARRFAPFEHVACDHVDMRGRRDGCPRCSVAGLLARAHPAPATVEACALAAADVPGMLAAEALARELAARLPGAPTPARVVWVAHEPAWATDDEGFHPWLEALEQRSRGKAPSVAREALFRYGEPRRLPWTHLARLAERLDVWTFDGRRAAPAFEAALALLATGYPVRLLDEEALVLSMPLPAVELGVEVPADGALAEALDAVLRSPGGGVETGVWGGARTEEPMRHADAAMVALDARPIGPRWRSPAGDALRTLMLRRFGYEMVFNDEVLAPEAAASVADALLAAVGPGARWLTNMELRGEDSYGATPVSANTFDFALVGVGPERTVAVVMRAED